MAKEIAFVLAFVAGSQTPATAESAARSGAAAASSGFLPKGTVLRVTPVRAITSDGLRTGQEVEFRLAQNVSHDDTVLLARGTPVKAYVSWHAGRNFFGKRAKFDVTFKAISVAGHDWPLSGRVRQMSPANTPGAWLDTLVARPKHAVMPPGEVFVAWTADDIPLSDQDATAH
jgi:hypothetical protein